MPDRKEAVPHKVSAEEKRVIDHLAAARDPDAEHEKLTILTTDPSGKADKLRHAFKHRPDGSDPIGVGDIVSDTAYNESTWNAVTDVAPSKNAIRDEIVSHYGNTDAHHAQAHEASHKASGSDEILLDELGATTDNTNLNSSTSAHGLLKRLNNQSTTYMSGTGIWSTPIGSGSVSAGNILLQSADTERCDVQAAYTKVKEFTVARGGTYRVKFDLKTQGAPTLAYAKVYRNGSPVGTETSDATGTYAAQTLDIAGWSLGDLMQLYAHDNGAVGFCVRNFRVYANAPETTTVGTD